MRPRVALGCGVGLVLTCAGALAAQEPHQHGRSADQLGRVVFPVSCTTEAVQRFEHAMALLHSFWWEQGVPAFEAVLASDATCAMAHWGIAMNAWSNPFAGGPAGDALIAGARAAERAAALGAPTARETGFIAAVGALYRDYATVSNAARLRAYSDTLARLYRDHPSDVEVAIYYALSLVATASPTDTTFERQKRAAAILNPLFRAHPEHPGLAHYIIHANDSPRLAPLGLEAARRYAAIAPSAPHAQHMPSHIFVRLGLWDETVASNQRSFDAGAAYAKTQGLAGVAPHEFHALDYMVYGYLQRGQDQAAQRVVAEAGALAATSDLRPLVAGYNGSAMAARLALERGRWRAAAELPVPEGVSLVSLGAVVRFARGIGAVRGGDVSAARAELDALAGIEDQLTRRGESYWARVVGIKRQAVAAWVALAAGDTAAALRDAKAAADREDVTEKHPVTPGELLPARELEADLLLAVGRFTEARRAYEATLAREPGRARSVYGVARAAELAGDRAAARATYREYLALMEGADGDRPELASAKQFLR
jgi:tetratricopeptide (TPR) repeat protein